ncbi:MAG TPA: phosphate ABC transporter permease [Planctomycetaceae bacterium]|nr:phosphate ABC transporter permease [Planctomycetaceae bacterium]
MSDEIPVSSPAEREHGSISQELPLNGSSTLNDPSEMTYYGRRSVWQSINPGEIWRYRNLIWQFALRDLKVRYRQTVIGALWAIIQPVVTMLVFGLLFSSLDGKPTRSGVPYAITSLCGLIPWQFFGASVIAATQSISSNAQLVQKVYFPKILLPLSALLPPLVDMGIASCVLICLMFWFGVVPNLAVITMPIILLALFLTTLACSFWLSSINAIYRDVQYVVPFIISIGLLISPVTYELPAVAERMSPAIKFIYCLNPFANLLMATRWAILGTPFPDILPMLASFLLMGGIFVGGVIYFGKTERVFADRV